MLKCFYIPQQSDVKINVCNIYWTPHPPPPPVKTADTFTRDAPHSSTTADLYTAYLSQFRHKIDPGHLHATRSTCVTETRPPNMNF